MLGVLAELSNVAARIASWNILGLPVITLLHSVWVSFNFRRSTRISELRPLQALVATWILSFGGTTMTAIILGKPWGWIQGPFNIPVYTIVPLFVYYSPGDVVYILLESVAFILVPILIFADALSKTFSISLAGVDMVRNHALKGEIVRTSEWAAILCGTVSGCGGGVLGSLFGVTQKNWSFNTPAQFRRPNDSLKLSFAASLVYWAMTNSRLKFSFTGLELALPPRLREGAVGLVFMLIVVVNFTANFMTLFSNTTLTPKAKHITLNRSQQAKKKHN